jgi:hypothetical protein
MSGGLLGAYLRRRSADKRLIAAGLRSLFRAVFLCSCVFCLCLSQLRGVPDNRLLHRNAACERFDSCICVWGQPYFLEPTVVIGGKACMSRQKGNFHVVYSVMRSFQWSEPTIKTF